MRSSNESSRRHALAALSGVLATALSGCGLLGAHDAVLADARPAAQQTTGPAADYPVVIGSPYKVGATLYTPSDALNYDEVGYAALDTAGGNTVSAAHHTLPVPSYAEVTSLTTGRTILVRVERRGPMDGNAVIALSPGAAAQLGTAAKTPVRVRRVNPPEPERAALRLGGRASDRLETPETLLAVLRRKLPTEGSVPLAQTKPASAELPAATPPAASAAVAAAQPAPPAAVPSPSLPPLAPLAVASTPAAQPQPPVAAAAPKLAPKPKPKASPPVTPGGAYVVQAGAFSTSDRARKVANAIGGSVSRTGSLFRVRTGPFGSRTQAEASLAKVKAAGYSDARIFTNG